MDPKDILESLISEWHSAIQEKRKIIHPRSLTMNGVCPQKALVNRRREGKSKNEPTLPDVVLGFGCTIRMGCTVPYETPMNTALPAAIIVIPFSILILNPRNHTLNSTTFSHQVRYQVRSEINCTACSTFKQIRVFLFHACLTFRQSEPFSPSGGRRQHIEWMHESCFWVWQVTYYIRLVCDFQNRCPAACATSQNTWSIIQQNLRQTAQLAPFLNQCG